MKIMYIGLSDDKLNYIRKLLENNRYDYIHYKDPKKAINNMQEVEPDIIIYREKDFPDLLAPFFKLLENLQPNFKPKFILLSTSGKKNNAADFVLSDDLNTPEKITELILSIEQNEDTPAEFLFSHPVTHTFITGKVKSITESTMEFVADHPDSASTITERVKIPYCTLKIGDEILSLSATLERNRDSQIFRFSEKDSKKLKKLLG